MVQSRTPTNRVPEPHVRPFMVLGATFWLIESVPESQRDTR